MNNAFKLILEQVKNKYLICQSGKAVTDCIPIKKELIQPTLDSLSEKILIPNNITKDMWTVVGSVGKKDVSGDIDIAVDINALQLQEIQIVNKLIQTCQNLPFEIQCNYEKQLHELSISYPIASLDDNSQVQIDIFFSTDLNYTKFKRFSPSITQSKYKGKLRGVLLDSLLEEVTLRGQDEENNPIEVKGITYPSSTYSHVSMTEDQFIRNFKTFKGKKPGKLNSTKTTLHDLRQYLGRDYMKVLKDILQMDIKQSDLISFESIWNNIIMSPDFPFKDKIPNIKQHVIGQLKTAYKQEYQKYIPEEIRG